MNYPADFVDAVVAEYPNFSQLHDALEQGKNVERFLTDGAHKAIPPESIVEMLTGGKADELLAEATKIIRRKQLLQDGIYHWSRSQR